MAAITFPKVPATTAEAMKALERIAVSGSAADASKPPSTGVDEGKARALVRPSGQGRVAGAMFAPQAKAEPNYDAMAAYIDSLPAEMRAEVLSKIAIEAFGGGK